MLGVFPLIIIGLVFGPFLGYSGHEDILKLNMNKDELSEFFKPTIFPNRSSKYKIITQQSDGPRHIRKQLFSLCK